MNENNTKKAVVTFCNELSKNLQHNGWRKELDTFIQLLMRKDKSGLTILYQGEQAPVFVILYADLPIREERDEESLSGIVFEAPTAHLSLQISVINEAYELSKLNSFKVGYEYWETCPTMKSVLERIVSSIEHELSQISSG